MNMRAFTFTADPKGRTDFRILYESFRALKPEKFSAEERPYLAAGQRLLEAASDPIGDMPDDADEWTVDLRLRRLKPKGYEMRMSQKLHEKMAGWVDGGTFNAGFAAAVDDFRERWDQAEKFTSDEEPGAARLGVVGKRGRK